jgi:adenylate cyclase
MKKWLFALVALIVILSVRFLDPWFLEVVRLKSLDTHQRSVPQEVISLERDIPIAVVTIDNTAINRNGQWPWPRDILTQEIIKLYEHGAGLVVLPMLFSEQDRFGKDAVFIDLLQQAPVIVGQIPALEGKGTPVPRGVSIIGEGWENWLYRYDQAIGPLKEIGDAAAGVGMLLTSPEADGVVRKLPLVVRIPTQEKTDSARIFPSMPMEIIRVIAGDPSYQMKIGAAGVEALRIPQFNTIYTDSNGSIYIDNHFKPQEFSLDNLPNFNGGVVIVSLTASGLDTTVPTPIGTVHAHDLIAASVYTMLEGVNISRPWWSDLSEIAIAAGVSTVVIITVLVLNWYFGIAILGVSLGALFYGSRYAFTEYGYLLDWSFPVFAVFVTWAAAAFLRFMEEFRLRQEIKKQFEHYLAPAMVKKLQNNPELLKLGGDTKHMTFLFCDIRGFTPISEQYKTNPQGLTKLVNRFLTPMTDLIMRNEGTVDKYMGDCIMAFWNAPLDIAEQEFKATTTALAMLESLKELNKELEKDGLMPINIGIGINSGEVVVGNMGSEQRFDYSVLGDAVNLAARLEGQSKGYHVKTIIGETTAEQINKKILCVELDKLAVKGKKEGVKIFTPLGEIEWWNENSAYAMDEMQHEKMLVLYRQKSFGIAKKFCEDMIKSNAWLGQLNEYYVMMMERCDEMKITELPDDWDGTYIATSK